MTEIFLKAFVPLFVAIDALGALPLVLSLSSEMTVQGRSKLVRKAVVAAFVIGLIFTGGGQAIFSFLGITENDFRVAGGILLLVFSIRDLVSPEARQGSPVPSQFGIVPIAIPIIMGPAALATLLVAEREYGFGITVLALAINLLIVWAVFSQASWILNKIGSEVSDAIAKIFSLLLAAIAVMLIRLGLRGMM